MICLNMRTLRVFVALALVLVNTKVNAGSLVNGLVVGAEEGVVANLTAMTPKGLSRFQRFKTAISMSPSHLKRTDFGSDKRLVLLVPENKGASGVLHKMEVSNEGQVTVAAYKIPESEIHPQTIGFSSGDFFDGIERVYNSVFGEMKVTQGYRVENINGRTLRVQRMEEVTNKDMRTYADFRNGNLHVSIRPAGSPLARESKLALEDFGINGQIVNFSVKPTENRIVVHVAEGPDIVEHTFSFSYSDENLHISRPSSARLTATEIKNLGLIADMKVISGRVAASAPVRGMEVEGAIP